MLWGCGVSQFTSSHGSFLEIGRGPSIILAFFMTHLFKHRSLRVMWQALSQLLNARTVPTNFVAFTSKISSLLAILLLSQNSFIVAEVLMAFKRPCCIQLDFDFDDQNDLNLFSKVPR